MKILLWLWQLPQNLIGFIYSRFAKSKDIFYFKKGKAVVFYAPCFDAGVALGQYIILDKTYKKISRGLLTTVKHEYGHTIQSKYLGWFYLLLVGIPSLCRNIMSRINPTKYNSEWYYSGFPEKQADKLGGVEREVGKNLMKKCQKKKNGF